ncbi:hypothetical protein C8J57DRAFT_1520961 [Mycena rebaudengoi]|nr:hypothetical protein C8J57DRAFT_1520961 [Mycena rebaudengoi]
MSHLSSKMIKFLAVPNARCSSTVGHYYLDLVEENGVFVQATVDGGSETGELYAAHVALRYHCMPDISLDAAPPFVALPSTDNIPIESSWHLFTNYIGLDIKQILLLGKSHNYFNPGFLQHVNLFNGCGPRLCNSALMTLLIIGTPTRFRPSAANSCHLVSLPTTSVTFQSGLA